MMKYTKMNLKPLKPMRKEILIRESLAFRIKNRLIRNYSLYMKLLNTYLKAKYFFRRHLSIMIFVTIFLVILILLIRSSLAPPVTQDEIIKTQANLLNLNTLLVFNLMWALALRYQKLIIPRGGITH